MPPNSSSSSFLGRLSARSSFISHKEVKVTVQLLNDADAISNEFKRSLPAQAILDYICELRNIREKDYLGLRYQDHNKHRYWVDLSRPISHLTKQLKSDSLALRLRFRFYPAEPSHLRENVSRYQLFMQLQRDLLHGRLYCPQNRVAELAALILQAQLGDYKEAVHTDGYVSQYKLLLKQTPRLEERIAEIHKSLCGKSTSEAELEFLEKASRLDTYGFDPYTIKDPRNPSNAAYLGVSHKGILIYQANQKIHHIPWSYLSKVDYIGKELSIYPMEVYVPPLCNGMSEDHNGNSVKERKTRLVLKYHCPSGTFAKHLWNHILSQQAFFNEQSALMIKPKFSKPRIPLLSRGSTFRYPSRRVLREIESTEMVSDTEANDNGPAFVRFELPRQEPRGEQPWLNKYHTLPNIKLNGNNNDSVQVDENAHEEATAVESTLTSVAQSPSSTSFVPSEPTNLRSRTAEVSTQQQSVDKCENVPEPPDVHEVSILQNKLEFSETTVGVSASNTENAAVVNGRVTDTSQYSFAEQADCSSQPLSVRCANVFISILLLLLLLLMLFIAVFEAYELRLLNMTGLKHQHNCCQYRVKKYSHPFDFSNKQALYQNRY